MKILSQYYQELMGKIKEDKEKIFEDWWLDSR